MAETIESKAMDRLEYTSNELRMALDTFGLLHDSFSEETVALSMQDESRNVKVATRKLPVFNNALSLLFNEFYRIHQETEQVFMELHEARKTKKEE